jgi:hypothetical protein
MSTVRRTPPVRHQYLHSARRNTSRTPSISTFCPPYISRPPYISCSAYTSCCSCMPYTSTSRRLRPLHTPPPRRTPPRRHTSPARRQPPPPTPLPTVCKSLLELQLYGRLFHPETPHALLLTTDLSAAAANAVVEPPWTSCASSCRLCRLFRTLDDVKLPSLV